MNPNESGPKHEYSTKNIEELRTIFIGIKTQVNSKIEKKISGEKTGVENVLSDWRNKLNDLEGKFNDSDNANVFEIRAEMIIFKTITDTLMSFIDDTKDLTTESGYVM